MSDIFFSIAIPAFKSSFLKECITSVLNQSYEKFELIIVNDCSPQPVGDVVSKFIDQRIKYYVNDSNTGAENVVDNWNICLNKASGDFFLLLGDDDIMDTDYLLEISRLIGKYPTVDVFHARTLMIDEDGKQINAAPSWPEFESVYENMWHRISGYRIQFISDFVYRTDKLKLRGGYYKLPLAWASDDITSFMVGAEGGIVSSLTPLFYYRVNSQTITKSGSRKLKLKAIQKEREWYIEFLKKIPENKIDQLYYQKINELITGFFEEKQLKEIAGNIAESRLSSFLFWVRNYRNYAVRPVVFWKALGYSLVQSVIKK